VPCPGVNCPLRGIGDRLCYLRYDTRLPKNARLTIFLGQRLVFDVIANSNIVDVVALLTGKRRCWHSKSSTSTEETTDPHPISPKSLVSEVDDEMYLRPSNGCHGDGASSSSNNSGSSPPGHAAPDPPRPSPSGHQGNGGLDNDAPAGSASRCSECCCCCNADACPPPKDSAAAAGPSTLGPPSRTGRLRQAATGASTGPAYRRAASCIEQNKYTHIWQMPLPIPGE